MLPACSRIYFTRKETVTRHRIQTTLILALVGGFVVSGVASNGWARLFNGKDLSGWRAVGDEKWTAQNGSIVGEAVTEKYGYLVTEKLYSDFILRLKFKCDAPGNYGLFIRSRITGEGKWGPDIQGPQVEIDPSRDTAGIYESGGREWLSRPTAESLKTLKPYDWNEMEVEANGSQIVTRLNGQTMVDFHDPEPRFHEGIIGLQLHSGGGGKIHFKDIEVKALNSKE